MPQKLGNCFHVAGLFQNSVGKRPPTTLDARLFVEIGEVSLESHKPCTQFARLQHTPRGVLTQTATPAAVDQLVG